MNKLRTAIVLCDKRSITIRLKRGFARQSGLAIQFIESIPIKLISNAQAPLGREMITLGAFGGFASKKRSSDLGEAQTNTFKIYLERTASGWV
ncbi:hypothetical protein BJI48_04085 [Helicobacter sp. 11S02596-1]|nr:hypothetical protein BJI48_04085 [Helicobacter sp. 11S02596-1]